MPGRRNRNALDNYHLGYVHRDNLADYDHRNQEQYACGERHWSFYEPPKKPGELPPSERGLAPIHEDTRWYGSSYGFVFPNTFVITGATFWSLAEVVPDGPETTTVRLRVRIAPGQSRAIALALAAESAGRLVRPLRALVTGVRKAVRTRTPVAGAVRDAARASRRYSVPEEDVFCCEALQRGIRSPHFAVGPIAPRFERGIQAFQRNVLDHVAPSG